MQISNASQQLYRTSAYKKLDTAATAVRTCPGFPDTGGFQCQGRVERPPGPTGSPHMGHTNSEIYFVTPAAFIAFQTCDRLCVFPLLFLMR